MLDARNSGSIPRGLGRLDARNTGTLSRGCGRSDAKKGGSLPGDAGVAADSSKASGKLEGRKVLA